MLVKVTTETGINNAYHIEYFEVPDDIPEEELEERIKEVALDKIEWTYEINPEEND
jgi:hypothetical protein